MRKNRRFQARYGHYTPKDLKCQIFFLCGFHVKQWGFFALLPFRIVRRVRSIRNMRMNVVIFMFIIILMFTNTQFQRLQIL